jgi:hypothetical protein
MNDEFLDYVEDILDAMDKAELLVADVTTERPMTPLSSIRASDSMAALMGMLWSSAKV